MTANYVKLMYNKIFLKNKKKNTYWYQFVKVIITYKDARPKIK